MIGEPVISVVMITIGLSSVLRVIIGAIWGTSPLPAPSFIPDDPIILFGASVGANRLWAIGLSIVMLAALTICFRRTSEGIAMRAVADDQQAALSMGISVKHIWAVSWAITATVGSILRASIFGGVGANIATVGLIVFPVVIMGGLDSIPGAIVGGLVIGLLRAYAGGYLPPELGLGEVAPFIALVFILLLRPYGLFGQCIIEHV
ncbi:MAG: branched-chain amino acid ABC transporter permease [Chloroflexi bacterium AL-W]|nr:branched-chain amino acid ABC transporter permease [Chloroflexi bacterium AL-N1]NOK64746.1 branched-chain amino acid ABC transporter permease [Chloroflexi bacterium AL-N10]NOK75987.1 branched-chain amino acid ABC transporter permease [Chloroflexi bacterium AL-N5]NOK80254.1 branched-chain amino acid ABC transporter permease [Chloroflexi bacterium AL-W]NOK86767.1 branched-chain amino acid ABC transporter permease [Chloroflexi bacterium AL-N15]